MTNKIILHYSPRAFGGVNEVLVPKGSRIISCAWREGGGPALYIECPFSGADPALPTEDSETTRAYVRLVFKAVVTGDQFDTMSKWGDLPFIGTLASTQNIAARQMVCHFYGKIVE